MDDLADVLKRHCGRSASWRVLVVDDDADLRQRLRGMLEKEGLEVDEAGDGRAALTRLDEQWPALILLDLLMPGMDGFAFLAELRRRGKGRSVPVVVLTAKELTVKLANGEISIPAAALRHWDPTKKDYVVDAASYELRVGAASDDIRSTATVKVKVAAKG